MSKFLTIGMVTKLVTTARLEQFDTPLTNKMRGYLKRAR
jgi:hypothetical protein